mgnify:CR=1 FL=1
MSKFGTSQPITRLEDSRFLTGKGRYVDDIAPDGALVAHVLRSTAAHGDIVALDVSAARSAPGVHLVLTAADLAAAGLKTMEILRRPGQYERLRALGQGVMDMQSAALSEHGIAHRICGDPTLFDVYFTDAEPVDYRSARHRDPAMNESWNAVLRANGVFKSPGKLYPSLALQEADLDITRSAIRLAAQQLAERFATPA